MNKSERRVLAVVKGEPGLTWSEVGVRAYPFSAVTRLNLSGRTFRDLTGKAVSLVADAVSSLEESGVIRRDEEHRFYPEEQQS